MIAAPAPPVSPPVRLLLISEHFAPSTAATAQLMSDLAHGLHRRGWPLTVLTATAGSSLPFTVRRLGGKGAADAVGVLAKTLRGVRFLVGSLLWCLRHGRRGDVVLIVSNPPFIGLLGPLIRCTRGLPYVFIFQDLFPRSAVLSGVLPGAGPLTQLWRSLMELVCRRSQATVVLSQAMEHRLRRDAGDDLPLAVIHNWAVEQADATPRVSNGFAREHGFADRFTLQYSGNFGRLHDLLTLLEAARLLRDDPVQFVFIGGGAKQRQIEAWLNVFALPGVLRLPHQPRERLGQSLGACDLAAIGLIPGAEDTVAPSKFYGILASGRGVVLIARRGCDLAQLVISEGCGIVVEPGEAAELADRLRQLSRSPDEVRAMGERAIALYRRCFGLERSLQSYEAVLAEAVQAGDAGAHEARTGAARPRGHQPRLLLLSYDVRRRGGVERLSLQVLASLRRQGLQVRLLTPRRLGPGPLGRWLGRSWFLLGLLVWLPRCDSVLSMHVLLLRPLRWLGWLQAHTGRAPRRLCWLHGIEVWGSALASVELDLENCQRLIASSHFTRDRLLEERSGNGPAIAVVHPMADLLDAGRDPEPLPPGLRLLTVARMEATDRYKGHRLVLEAMALLLRRGRLSEHLRWRVVGDGDDRPALEALTRRLGLEPWVRFLGPLRDAELGRELRTCSLLLLPSAYGINPDGRAMGEGFGIVYLEAAQAGRASIACRRGGQTDLIQESDTGWLIDPDPNSLAALLLELLDDPRAVEQAGLRAHQRARTLFNSACFDRALARAIGAVLPQSA